MSNEEKSPLTRLLEQATGPWGAYWVKVTTPERPEPHWTVGDLSPRQMRIVGQAEPLLPERCFQIGRYIGNAPSPEGLVRLPRPDAPAFLLDPAEWERWFEHVGVLPDGLPLHVRVFWTPSDAVVSVVVGDSTDRQRPTAYLARLSSDYPHARPCVLWEQPGILHTFAKVRIQVGLSTLSVPDAHKLTQELVRSFPGLTVSPQREGAAIAERLWGTPVPESLFSRRGK
jgi:hypothetical protein